VNVTDKVVKSDQYLEVTGFKSVQSDVEVAFAIKDLSKAEQFDPAWLQDPQALCKKRGARVAGEVGPFGLWVLAAGDLTERTAVFFRVFKTTGSKHVVLMCNDPTNSTFESQVYRPTFAGFVNVDIAQTKKIALRTLVRARARAGRRRFVLSLTHCEE
jgi:beta-fructofuranosidase